VFATSSGQPCYNATYSSSYCSQAWQWNLDYVTDPHGDAVAYFYNTETNDYARDNGTTANSAYTQAGALSKIEYGLRAGAVYGHTPAAQVNFTAGTSRTDIPTDLTCASGASCDVNSPTFWGKYQLTTISTQALEGSSLASVDSWSLAQTYPSTGDPTSPASLWLSSITHTGADTDGGGSSASVPAVRFSGLPLANRVMTAADLDDGYSIITRYRLTQITEETGGQIGVSYDTPGGACTSGNFPVPDANTALCYPDYWSPPGVSNPVEDWFNKYVVTAVTQANTVGGGVPVQTSYSYSGAAWHYNDDTLTRSKQRTWDEWRGFRTVTTETGASPDPVTQTTDTYLQGMNGDYQSSGGTSTATLTSSRGDTVTDSDQYAGMGFEHIVDDGVGGAEVSDAITIPWSSAATATQSQPSPLPALTAHLTGTAEKKTYTPLASGGTRESDDTFSHDSYGRVTRESDVPDTADAAEDTCTSTSYADSTSAWILDLTAEVTEVSVPCATTPVLPGDAISDTLTFYDGSTTLGAAPTKGDITETEKATAYSGSTPAYAMQSKATYDAYGRVLTSTDADNRTTSTAYTPATGAEATSVTVTDPAGLVTSTTYDPARDLPVQSTNAAAEVTSETYDGLGRLTAVWLPGHPKASASADEKFSYFVSSSAASVATTSTLNDTGAYTVSETLYDSLGRTAETQAATPDGGRDISDTFYNSLGLTSKVSNSYYTTGAPNGTIYAAVDGKVPSQTGYAYDGDQRVTRQISYSMATETWETDTAYEGGDATTVTYQNLKPGEPTGGVPQTTFTNGEGKTSAIYQYHSEADADLGPSAPAADYDKTSYAYTPGTQLMTVTDAAGNTWSYTYNLNGDQTSQTDPDSGTTSSTYDPAGQLTSATDARDKTVGYTYDADGRTTAEYDTTGNAPESASSEIASWTYDTLAKGMATSSTTYYNGNAYTQEIVGYNSYGLPTGSKTIIPSAEGELAGTYTTGETYDPDTMAPTGLYQSAAGGLPAETVNTGYDTVGDPVSVGSSLWTYAAAVSYSEYEQPLQYNLGPSTSPVYITDAYDQQTQALTGQQVETGSNGAVVDATGYAYDNVGNVLSESDAPSGGPTQDQCFQYNYLGRLSQAWSQGSSSCVSSPSASAEGGAAPYWDVYTYGVTGNLTSQVSTQPSGTSVTTTNSFPTPGSAQPHAVTTSTNSGTGTTRYGYDPSGHLTSASGPSSSQSLSWDDAGRLSSVATTGGTSPGTTSYLYDASGNLLLQKDAGTTTLYLGDEQIVLSSAGALSGTRYYSVGGQTIASRTSSGAISYLAGDREGTSLLSIDSSTQAVTRRYYDPYGNPIGSAPSSWAGTRGFVGGTADPSTGLIDLGAREYQAATGAFVSPDPLVTPYDPQDLNAYSYASGNPSTDSDPSGAMRVAPGGGGGSSGGGSSGGGGSCPDYDPGCPGFTGGGAGPGGESLYGPGYGSTSSGGGSSCPLWAPGCPGFTGGGAGPGGESLYGPGYRPPAPVSRHVTTGSPSLAGCVGGRGAVLDPTPCHMTPPKPSSGGFDVISWADQHIVQPTARGLQVAYHWTMAYRGTLATVLAIAGCLIPGVDAGCAGYLMAALAIREQQRVAEYGFRRSLTANAADLITSVAFGLPMGAFTGVEGETAPLVAKLAALVPDATQFVGGFIPGHDPVFFNGNTLGPN
jgi:RHS repeat-associated protein